MAKWPLLSSLLAPKPNPKAHQSMGRRRPQPPRHVRRVAADVAAGVVGVAANAFSVAAGVAAGVVGVAANAFSVAAGVAAGVLGVAAGVLGVAAGVFIVGGVD